MYPVFAKCARPLDLMGYNRVGPIQFVRTLEKALKTTEDPTYNLDYGDDLMFSTLFQGFASWGVCQEEMLC